MKSLNPFPVSGYSGVDLFCDREREIALLSKNLGNGVNTTLISIRRMGKSSLIQRVFEEMKTMGECICLYIDLYPTQNLKDLTRQMATVVMKELPPQKKGGKKFLDFIKGFRPVITYDPLTGAPELKFDYAAVSDYEVTVSALFNYLEAQKLPVYLAFDEFQQIAVYNETNAESLLRTLIQPLKNVSFIFSGSSRHMMAEIFSSSQRPFFSTTRMMGLSPIPFEKYATFIAEKFKQRGRHISDESVTFILNWTLRHTYYTQAVCNALFTGGRKNINTDDVKAVCTSLLEEQEKVFLQYRSLLTQNQWNTLVSIAREEKVHKPYSIDFLMKHSLVSPANTRRAIEALMEKQMIYQEEDDEGSYYAVYELFLSRWLERW